MEKLTSDHFWGFEGSHFSNITFCFPSKKVLITPPGKNPSQATLTDEEVIAKKLLEFKSCQLVYKK